MVRKSKIYLFRKWVIGFFAILILGFCSLLFLNIRNSGNTPPLKSPYPSPTVTSLASVQKVIDGDTIDIVIDGKKERVRLIGIDAPEFGDGQTKTMCFARESYVEAKKILDEKTVRLESDPTQDDRDKYERLLRYVFLDDGTFVNEVMVAAGFAREYTYLGIPYQYQKEFQEAESDARNNHVGMWGDGACPVVQ